MDTIASLLRLAPIVLAGALAASGGERPTKSTDVAIPTVADADSAPEGLEASDWSGIRAVYEAGRHRIVSVEGGCEAERGWSARNPGQGLNTTFDERGFTTRPDAGGWSWGLDLQGYGWGVTELVAGPCSTSAEGGRLSREWDDRLAEWYVNDSRGLEHGFTVASRPSGANAPLTLDLSIRGGLQPVVSPDGRNVAFTDAQGGTALNYNGLTVIDSAGKTVTAKWCSIGGDRLRLQVDDAAADYPLTIDPVVQQAYLKASNPWVNDRFGVSVAISGDTVVVGAYQEDSNATGVNGNQADDSALESGAAYVFVRSGGVWSQQAYLKASNTEAGDNFGGSVAISGDTVVVGAGSEDSSAAGVNGNQADNSASSAGAVYVFVRSGAVWSQQAYLKASNPGANDLFGSVAISGDTVVVGATSEDSSATGVNGNQADNSASASGAAYVFVRSSGLWSQQAYLKASNTDSDDQFGRSVAVSGDTVVVGANFEESNATGVNGNQADNSATWAGAAYVFTRSNGAWSQQAYLKASNAEAHDVFGNSVDVSGDTVVVGASGEDSGANGVNGNQGVNGASSAGAAYVFVRSGGVWSQQAYLKASNSQANDRFGGSVAMSGDTVVIGALGEASNATGVNGNQANNTAQYAGAAYVFVRSGDVWSQLAYVKASNAQMVDSFGFRVAVSGETVVAGAPDEDSGATGVNGDDTDNGVANSGAAYVYTLSNSVTYCTAGTSTNGCVPSISATGWPILAATAGFSIHVANVEGQKQGLLFYGLSGRAAIVWGTGGTSFQCLRSPTQRTQAQNSGGTSGLCDGTLSEDWLAYLATHPGALGQPFAAGTTVNVQAWYRDPPAAKSTNLSDALEFEALP